MTTVSSVEPLLLLLQLSDSAIPIGGYSHSWGLETWVQNEIIKDADSARESIKSLLAFSIAPQDGIAAGIAHRYCLAGEPERLAELNQYLSASKWSKETYQASVRMGARLLKLAREAHLVSSLNGLQIEDRSLDGQNEGTEFHHSVAFGWLAACGDVCELSMLSAYLQNSANCLVSACVRLIPLGHTDGQQITVSLRPLVAELADQCVQRQLEEITSFAPLNEAASHAHESLYSRLFQS